MFYEFSTSLVNRFKKAFKYYIRKKSQNVEGIKNVI